MADIIVTNTDTVVGHEIAEYRGVIVEETLHAASGWKDFMSRWRRSRGGEIGSYKALMKEARQAAYRDLLETARALGADAVVGFDLSTSAFEANHGLLVKATCQGTAVTLRKKGA